MAYRLLSTGRRLENLVWKTFKQFNADIPRVSPRTIQRLPNPFALCRPPIFVLRPLHLRGEALEIRPFLLQNNSTLKRAVLKEWRLFCEKPPKGFEKYFKEGKPAAKDAKPEEAAKDAKEAKGGEAKPEQKAPKPSLGAAPGAKKPYDQWSFGLFGGTGSR